MIETNNQQLNRRQSFDPLAMNELENEVSCMESESEIGNRVSNNSQNIEVDNESLKSIDKNEICKQIFKVLPSICSKTLAAPYMKLNAMKQKPFFYSLQSLIDRAQLSNHTQALVVCELQMHSFSPLTNVYVHCKKCDYVNFSPLSWASVHQTKRVEQLLADLNKSEIIDNLSNEIKIDDLDEQKKQNAVNFSLKWLHQAKPKKWEWLHNALYYECPRCLYNQQDEESTAKIPLLEYMYRFWFKLKDASSEIDYCLMESDIAEK